MSKRLLLLAILGGLGTAAMTASVKAVTTEARLNNLVTAHNALSATTAATAANVSTIQGQLTGNTAPTNASGFGATSTANVGTTSGPSDTGYFNTSGQVGGAAAHYHTLPDFPQADHTHAFGGHTHDFGGHYHQL